MSSKVPLLASCEWRKATIQGTPPSPRQAHGQAVIDECIFIFGGSLALEDGEKFEFYNDLFSFTVEGDIVKWTAIPQKGNVPCKRDSHSMCSVGNKIFLYGGKACSDSRQCIEGLFIFDTVTQQWELVKSTGTAPLTLGHTMTAVGSVLYVIGGIQNGEACNNVWMFHLDLCCWVPLRVSGLRPSPRCDHAAAVVNSKIYIFGGSGAEDVYFNDVHVLDTESLTWKQPKIRGSPPPPRACHVFTAHKSKDIYVFGGTTGSSEGDITVYADLCKLSLSKSRWKWPLSVGECAQGRFGHVATIIHSVMYMFGGVGKIAHFNDVTMLHLINPSDRQLAVKPLLDPCECLSANGPTRLPHLKYSLQPSLYPEIKVQDTPTAPVSSDTQQCLKDLQNLKTQTAEVVERALGDLSDRYDDLLRRETEIAEANERLQRERAEYEEMYNEQQMSLKELVRQHRLQIENWLLSRRKENDRDRETITKEKMAIHQDRVLLEMEREKLKKQAEQLRSIARQFNQH